MLTNLTNTALLKIRTLCLVSIFVGVTVVLSDASWADPTTVPPSTTSPTTSTAPVSTPTTAVGTTTTTEAQTQETYIDSYRSAPCYVPEDELRGIHNSLTDPIRAKQIEVWIAQTEYWSGNAENTICFKPIRGLYLIDYSGHLGYGVNHIYRSLGFSWRFNETTNNAIAAHNKGPAIRGLGVDTSNLTPEDDETRVYTLYLERELFDNSQIEMYYTIEPPLHPNQHLEFRRKDPWEHSWREDPQQQYYLYEVMIVGRPDENVNRKTYTLTVWNSLGQEHSRDFEYYYIDRYASSANTSSGIEVIDEEDTIAVEDGNPNRVISPSPPVIKADYNLNWTKRYLIEEPVHRGNRLSRNTSLYCPNGFDHQVIDINNELVSSDTDLVGGYTYEYDIESFSTFFDTQYITVDRLNGNIHYTGPCIDYEAQTYNNHDLVYKVSLTISGRDGSINRDVYIHILDLNEDDIDIVTSYPDFSVLDHPFYNNIRYTNGKLYMRNELRNLRPNSKYMNPDSMSILKNMIIQMDTQNYGEDLITVRINNKYVLDVETLVECSRSWSKENGSICEDPFWRQSFTQETTLYFGDSKRTIPSSLIKHYFPNRVPTPKRAIQGRARTIQSQPFVFSNNDPLELSLIHGLDYHLKLPTAFGGSGNITYDLQASGSNQHTINQLGLQIIKDLVVTSGNRLSGILHGTTQIRTGQPQHYLWVATDGEGNSVHKLLIITVIERNSENLPSLNYDVAISEPNVNSHLLPVVYHKPYIATTQLDLSGHVNNYDYDRIEHPVVRIQPLSLAEPIEPLEMTENTPVLNRNLYPYTDARLPAVTGGISPYKYRIIGSSLPGIKIKKASKVNPDWEGEYVFKGKSRYITEQWENLTIQITDSTPGTPKNLSISIPYRVYPDQDVDYTFEEATFTYNPFEWVSSNPARVLKFDYMTTEISFSRTDGMVGISPNFPFRFREDGDWQSLLNVMNLSDTYITYNPFYNKGKIRMFWKGKQKVLNRQHKYFGKWSLPLTNFSFQIRDGDLKRRERVTGSFNFEITHPGIGLRQNGNCEESDEGFYQEPEALSIYRDSEYYEQYNYNSSSLRVYFDRNKLARRMPFEKFVALTNMETQYLINLLCVDSLTTITTPDPTIPVTAITTDILADSEVDDVTTSFSTTLPTVLLAAQVADNSASHIFAEQLNDIHSSVSSMTVTTIPPVQTSHSTTSTNTPIQESEPATTSLDTTVIANTDNTYPTSTITSVATTYTDQVPAKTVTPVSSTSMYTTTVATAKPVTRQGPNTEPPSAPSTQVSVPDTTSTSTGASPTASSPSMTTPNTHPHVNPVPASAISPTPYQSAQSTNNDIQTNTVTQVPATTVTTVRAISTQVSTPNHSEQRSSKQVSRKQRSTTTKSLESSNHPTSTFADTTIVTQTTLSSTTSSTPSSTRQMKLLTSTTLNNFAQVDVTPTTLESNLVSTRSAITPSTNTTVSTVNTNIVQTEQPTNDQLSTSSSTHKESEPVYLVANTIGYDSYQLSGSSSQDPEANFITNSIAPSLTVFKEDDSQQEQIQPHGITGFLDNQNTPHQQDIEQLASMGITQGCNPPHNTLYCPDRTVTRAEIATLLVRAFQVSPTNTDHFIDDGVNTHHQHINRLANANLVQGCNPPLNTLYCPNRVVTRAEFATLLTRILDLPISVTAHQYTDIQGNTHQDGIATITQIGIAQGCNPPRNTRFCPDRPLSRAEFATLLVRALEI